MGWTGHSFTPCLAISVILCSSFPCLIMWLKYYFPKIILLSLPTVYVPATASMEFPIEVRGCDWHFCSFSESFQRCLSSYISPILYTKSYPHFKVQFKYHYILKVLRNTPFEYTIFIHYSILTSTHYTHISLFHRCEYIYVLSMTPSLISYCLTNSNCSINTWWVDNSHRLFIVNSYTILWF